MSSNAMVPTESQASRSLVLGSFSDFVRFGEFAAASQFAPAAMRGKPGDCTLAVILGAEIGLGPMASLQNISVINGKPSVYGDAMLAVCMASPVCESVHEWTEGDGDNTVAFCRAQRRGYPEATPRSFSVSDAKKAGLWTKDVWKAYPTRMLQMRARGFALRDTFPDVLRGVISREEAEDYPTERPERPERSERPQTVTATRVEPSQEQAPAKRPPRQRKARGEAGEDAVQVEGVVEKALAVIAFADTVESLAEYQLRADSYLADGKISKEQHDSITAAVDERADFLRTQKAIGSPDSDGK